MESLAHRPFFLLTALALIVLELGWRRFVLHRSYDLKGMAASFGVALGDGLSRLLSGGAISAVFAAAWAVTPLRLDATDWKIWLLAFFAVEFAYYWMHRLSHEVRWLWATHAVHHSAHELVLPSAIRLGWTGLLSGGWLIFVPLVLLGFAPRMIVALLAINLAYQFFLHTELIGRLGPLERVLNTPSHHRVHHASNAEYIDMNFGGVLIIYDRLFGTFASERADIALHYGLVHNLRSSNPFVIALHEWGRMFKAMRGAGSLRGAFQVAAGRPA